MRFNIIPTSKMSLNAYLSLYYLTIFLLAFSTITKADNITHAFEKYSNFSTMSSLLIKTKLTIPFTKYHTLTVLAVNNKAITTITNKSDIELKSILMTHIILDYYDELKLKGLKEKSMMLTTLYQTTGLGQQMNGFLNCTKTKGKVYFGSGVKNSPLDSEYVTTLYHNPFNLSIIQISRPIVAPGLSFVVDPPPLPLAPAPSPMDDGSMMSPSPSPMDDSPSPGPGGEESGSDSVVPKATQEADSPASAPSDDDEKIEAADKAGQSSSACKDGLSIVLVLSLAFFAF